MAKPPAKKPPLPRLEPQAPRPSAASRVVGQLEANRAQAMRAAGQLGGRKLAQLMRRAKLVLDKRIAILERRNPNATFTIAAQRQTMEQVRAVTRMLRVGVEQAVREQGHDAAVRGADAMVRYLVDAERAYTGISTLGPRIEDAVHLDVAVAGADASVLRRVATDPRYRGKEAQAGVMDRYGIAVTAKFEQTIQTALLTNQPWAETRIALTMDSEWLQQAGLSWAERILRTEVAGAINRAAHDTMRQAEEELGPMLRILCAVFDDRTSWDSIQVHGMVRRMDEPFEDGMGRVYMSPPNRPNDRECVVPHMQDWPLPAELLPRSDDEVQEAWVRQTRSKKHPEGRPGGPPPRPLMSTVPGFGGED